MTEERLLQATGNHAENPTMSVLSRCVFDHCQKRVEIIGPVAEVEEEIIKVQRQFWARAPAYRRRSVRCSRRRVSRDQRALHASPFDRRKAQNLPSAELSSFLARIPAPLALGNVELADDVGKPALSAKRMVSKAQPTSRNTAGGARGSNAAQRHSLHRSPPPDESSRSHVLGRPLP